MKSYQNGDKLNPLYRFASYDVRPYLEIPGVKWWQIPFQPGHIGETELQSSIVTSDKPLIDSSWHGCVLQSKQLQQHRPQTELWKTTMFTGKTHFDWAMFNTYVTNYQSEVLQIPKNHCYHYTMIITFYHPYIINLSD